MGEGLNRVMLMGNLGAEPELRLTQGGTAVLNMRLATTESYLDKDKVRRERTDWHNVVVWGKRGEALAKMLHKGSRIFIEGSIRTSSYDDRDGKKRYKTEIVASNVLLGGGRGGGDDESGGHDEGSGGGYSRSGGGQRAQGGRPPPGSRGRTTPSNDRSTGGGDGGAPAEDFDQGGGYGGSDDDVPF